MVVGRLQVMEERIVLDGALAPDAAAAPTDAGADGAAAVEGVAPAADAAESQADAGGQAAQEQPVVNGLHEALQAAVQAESATPAATVRALLVNSQLDNYAAIAGAAGDNVVVCVYDGGSADLAAILQDLQQKADGKTFASIAIATHGAQDGQLHLSGTEIVTADTLAWDAEQAAFFSGLGALLSADGRIDLLSCDSAAGTQGAALLQGIAAISGKGAAGSIDITGGAAAGGDWDLEAGGVDAGALYFAADELASLNAVELLSFTAPVDSDGDGWFEIDSAADLIYISTRSAWWGYDYTLQNSINFLDLDNNGLKETTSVSYVDWNGDGVRTAADSYGFNPIGTLSGNAIGFTGRFLGNGYTISNLYISRASSNYVGLFGMVDTRDYEVVIQDVVVAGATVTGRSYAGALVGGVWGDGSSLVIDGCGTTGKVTAAYGYTGGLVGYASFTGLGLDILNSYSSCTISGGNYSGGLIGYASGVTVVNSYASGMVTGSSNVGGLAGWFDGSIDTSYALGKVTAKSSAAGGLVGTLYGDVARSYAAGAVASSSSYVGGFVGYVGSGSEITSSYCDGAVSGSGTSYVGSFTGYIRDSILANCWVKSTTRAGIGTFYNADYSGLSSKLVAGYDARLGWDDSVWSGLTQGKSPALLAAGLTSAGYTGDFASMTERVDNSAASTITGNVLDNDAAAEGDTVANYGTHALRYGSLTIAADGSWTYSLDNANADVNGLNAGEALKEVFTYAMAGGLSADDSRLSALVITIRGANDTAGIAADTATIYYRSGTAESDALTGNVLTNDFDDAALTVTNAGTLVGSYGSLVLAANGSYTYTLNKLNASVTGLTGSQTLSDVFSIAVAGVTRNLTVTVTAAQTISQLVTASTWTQSGTYDDYCPKIGTSRALTGCVATAVAQVLSYYDFIDGMVFNSNEDFYINGVNYSLNDATAKTLGFPNAAALNAAIDAIDPDNLTAADKALLSFAAGVKVGMNYGLSGSGAFVTADEMIYGFDFLTATEVNCGSDGPASPAEKQMIISELVSGGPVLLAMYSASSGHEVFIDGYNATNDMFHINMGWGGYADGWYTLCNIYGYTRIGYVMVDVSLPDSVTDLAADTATVTEASGTAAQSTVSGNVLTNDSGYNSSDLTVLSSGVIKGVYGTLRMNADGSYVYTLNNDNAAVQRLYSGQSLVDTFSYVAQDAKNTFTQKLNITINGVSDARGSQDFNGDGKSDLVWQNSQTGAISVWTMNGETKLGEVLIHAGTGYSGYSLDAVGDIDGDNDADIILTNNATGARVAWIMNGTVISKTVSLGTVGVTSRLCGAGDLNFDGQDDLVFQNTVDGKITVWYMNGGVRASTAVLADAPAASEVLKAVGDLTGDGKADLVFVNSVLGSTSLWQMDGAVRAAVESIASESAATPGTGWVLSSASDYTADGKADLVWHSTLTGAVKFWNMNAATVSAAADLAGQAIPLRVAGEKASITDINNDGRDDLFYQNVTTGQVYAYCLNNTGALVSVSVYTGTALKGWTLSAVGDLDGDGDADMAFSNYTTGARQVWIMSGTKVVSTVSLGVFDKTWTICGAGDFNADGKEDLLLQQFSTGTISVWYMDGGTKTGTASIANTLGAAYRVSAIADFNRDGRADLVFKKSTSNETVVWMLDADFVAAASSTLNATSSTMQLAGAGDMNGDGIADLIWRDTKTGKFIYWYMNSSGNYALTGSRTALATTYRLAV